MALDRGGIREQMRALDNGVDYLNDSQFTEDTSFDLENRANVTCPADILAQFNESLNHDASIFGMNSIRDELRNAAHNALLAQDPCTIPDDVRDELMRQKRKQEAYKTALCESYKRTKSCAYGESCRFAHGVEELRLPLNPRGKNHPKYKTVLCDKFSTTGVCKYGTRCQFIHKVVNPALLAQARIGRPISQNYTGLDGASSSSSGHPFMSSSSRGNDFSTTFENSLALGKNQAPLSGRNIDHNQSMPYSLRHEDFSRGFARATGKNPFVNRLAKTVESRHASFAGDAWAFSIRE